MSLLGGPKFITNQDRDNVFPAFRRSDGYRNAITEVRAVVGPFKIRFYVDTLLFTTAKSYLMRNRDVTVLETWLMNTGARNSSLNMEELPTAIQFAGYAARLWDSCYRFGEGVSLI
jgi:hypothetical protein